MGANSASEGFLRAYLRHSRERVFHAVVDDREAANSFAHEVKEFALYPGSEARTYSAAQTSSLAQIGAILNFQPLLEQSAWQRSWEGSNKYSILGMTHTTCTQTVMDAVGRILIAPLESWDALVCTSQSVKITLDRVLSDWFAYLSERLGAMRKPMIEFPIIPLGVDCEQFDSVRGDAGHRNRLRSRLGINDEDVVFLFFGRLSYHAKANPYPMYRALEETAKRTNKRLQLILSGWFANEAIEQHFRRAAAEVCPSIRLIVVDGRKPEIRREIWNAADVFTSLSDNIQETFGLTPIEAMAAGLPSVISDWDGYRDTVRHHIDGFRIPTTIAPADDGEIFIRRHFNGVDDYDRYIGHVSHFVAVNIPLAIDAYVALCENPTLRAEMGEAARKRACEVFHWREIVRQYQELLRELAERRQQHRRANTPTNRSAHPLRSDPFHLFGEYATAQLSSSSQLVYDSTMCDADLVRLFHSPYLVYMKHPELMASLEECRQILRMLPNVPKPVSELIDSFSATRQSAIRRSLVWLLKVGMIRIVGPARLFPEDA